jgi:hypothetical protein
VIFVLAVDPPGVAGRYRRLAERRHVDPVVGVANLAEGGPVAAEGVAR